MAVPSKRVIVDIKNGRDNLLREFGIYIEPEENNLFICSCNFFIRSGNELNYF